MRTHCLLFLVITAMLFANSSSAQQVQTDAEQQPANAGKPASSSGKTSAGQSLSETLNLIKQTLETHGLSHRTTTYKTSEGGISSMSVDYRDQLATTDGCRVTIKNTQTNHAETSPETRTTFAFSLSDVDPDTIKVEEVGPVHQENTGVDSPDNVVTVDFATTNNTESIRRISNSDSKSPVTSNVSSLRIVVSDQNIGGRLAKTLTHAVTLCGGKKSIF